MTPYWTQLARRNWQPLLAVAVFAGFTLLHAGVFRPTLERYRGSATQAARLGVQLDVADQAPPPSGPAAALLARNSLLPDAAEEQGASGGLAAELLSQVTRLAAQSGIEVLSTEQGLVTQLPGAVVVRAHFRMNGSYARFTALMGEFARSGVLLTPERFTIDARPSQGGNIEIWVSRLVLKRTGARR